MTVKFTSRLPEIQRELRARLPRALEVGAEVISEEAKRRVPVSSGALQNAIHVERRTTGGAFADFHVVAGDEHAFYGHMIEHGTTRAAPRPFLVPAFEARKVEVVGLLSEMIRDLR